MYSDKLLLRFHEATHVGVLPQPAMLGQQGNPTCGDVVEIYIRTNDGLISDARFKALGCAVTIAAADAICEAVAGTSPTEATFLDIDQVIAHLGGIPEGRRPCVEAPLAALRSALGSIRIGRA